MSSAGTWIDFFTAAGIPRSQCDNYATIFVKNRIHINMLSDLNKEYLREMGITSIGDIIGILRQAKTVIEKRSRDQILSTERSEDVKPKIIKLTSDKPVKSSTFTGTPRRVLPEHEGKYKVSLPKGSTEKSREMLAQYSLMNADKVDVKKSIFDRLQSQNKPTSPIKPRSSSSSSATSSSIFKRLGDYKEAERKSSKRSSGILKNSPIKKARLTITREKTIKKAIIRTSNMRMDRDDDDDDDEMMDAEDKQVSFSPKVQVHVFEEDPEIVAQRRQVGNTSVSVKSRLDLHPRAIKITSPNKNVGGINRNTRKNVLMKPKRNNLIEGTLKSDAISKQMKPVKSRLDMKKRNQSQQFNNSRNGASKSNTSVFNRLNR